jgi:hypothetical protein
MGAGTEEKPAQGGSEGRARAGETRAAKGENQEMMSPEERRAKWNAAKKAARARLAAENNRPPGKPGRPAGVKQSPETIERIRLAKTGFRHTDASKERMRKAALGRVKLP